MAINFDIFFRGHSTDFKAAASEVLKIGQHTGKELERELGGKLKELFALVAGEEAMRRTIEFADHITDLSTRLGVSTKHLQEWGFAADHAGSSIEDVTSFLEHLSVAREAAIKGDQEMIRDFRQLGIGLDALRHANINDLATTVAGTVRTKNPQDILPALRSVGGKGVGALIPAMKELDEFKKKAEEAGAILDDHLLQSLKAIKEEFQSWASVIRGPLAWAIDKLRKGLGFISDLARIGAGGIGTFLGALSGGASFKEALAQMQEFEQSIEAERAKKEADIKKRGEEQGKVETPFSSTKPFPNEKQPLNSWQQLGAAVRFAEQPKQITLLERIARSSEATERAVEKQSQNTNAIFSPLPSFGP